MKKSVIHLAFFGLIFNTAAQATDLEALYQSALKNDPSYAAAIAQNVADAQMVKDAKGNLLPNIGAKVNYGLSNISNDPKPQPPSATPEGDITTFGYSVSLMQPVYNHGAWQGLKAAKAVREGGQMRYAAAGDQLLLRVVQAYFGVQQARDNLMWIDAEQKAIARQYQNAKHRFDVGHIARTDLLQVQAAADLIKAKQISGKNQLIDAETQLHAITGFEGEIADFNAANIQIAPNPPEELATWQQKAQSQNRALQAALADYQSAQAVVKAQGSGHFPSLNLVAQHKFENNKLEHDIEADKTTNAVMLELNVPIYAGGKVSSAVDKAIANKDAALTALNFQRRQAEQTTRQAYLQVQSAIASVAALTQAEKSSEASKQAVLDGFDAGTRTSVDILQAERDLLATKRDLQNARYQYALSVLLLKQSAGELDFDALAALGL